HVAVDRRTWGRRYATSLIQQIIEHDIEILIFDGAAIYPEVVAVKNLLDVPLVWVRRGNWKVEVSTNSMQYNQPETVCDLLIEPGEIIQNPTTTRSTSDQSGLSFSHCRVAPVVSTSVDEMLSKEAAKEFLALDRQKNYVLIQLGAGRINEIEELMNVATAAVSDLGDRWEPVVAVSPLNQTHEPASRQARRISVYPLARTFNAFE